MNTKLIQYISDYINEELARGAKYITPSMIEDAIEAFKGGAR